MEISSKKNENLIDGQNDINEITIIYKSPINKESETRIFGNNFVINNKDKCKIIFKNKQYDLVEKFNLENINEIKLNGIKKITNMSCMFYKCYLLLSLPDIDKMNTSQVIDMSKLFCGCESLLSLPDISKWNTSKVNNMNSMFRNCFSLSYIPNIGKWDISSVKDINYIFLYCRSLIMIPDISNWNTMSIENMDDICSECISLSGLPDISKWKLEKITSNFEISFSRDSSMINCQKKSINLFNNYFRIQYNNILEKLCNKSEMNKEEILNIFNELDEDYNISAFIGDFEVIKKIIEYNGDKDKITNFVEDLLIG